MIDGIKIQCDITTTLDDILNIKGMGWEFPVKQETGEQVRKYFTKWKSLRLTIKVTKNGKAYLIIEGSIHSYWHGGNYTPFYYYQLCDALDTLSNNLLVDLSKCKITNLEVGVNIETAGCPSSYYKDLILHKLKPFTSIDNSRNKRKLKGVQCIHTEWVIKCYDKGEQYGILDYNLMRFEVKFLKMRPILKKTGKPQISLSDLKDVSVLTTLGNILAIEYKNILKVKNVNHEVLKSRDKELINNGQYPKFWMNLRDSEGKSKYDTKLKRFKTIQVKYAMNNCKHSTAYQQIVNVYYNLLNNIQLFPIRQSSIYTKGLGENVRTKEIDAKSPLILIDKESIREKVKLTLNPN